MLSYERREAQIDDRSRSVTGRIPYRLEGDENPPAQARLLVTDEDTGQTVEALADWIETIEKGISWSDDFEFPITIEDYGAESFLLEETEIPKDAELSDYKKEFLAYLGLPESDYRISSIEWDGEPYERDGILYRDASAKGEKRIREVEAVYGTQVNLPSIMGYTYHCIYEEKEGETEEMKAEETEEAAEETATTAETEETAAMAPQEEEEPLGELERLRQWLRNHMTVLRISIFFLQDFFLACCC